MARICLEGRNAPTATTAACDYPLQVLRYPCYYCCTATPPRGNRAWKMGCREIGRRIEVSRRRELSPRSGAALPPLPPRCLALAFRGAARGQRDAPRCGARARARAGQQIKRLRRAHGRPASGSATRGVGCGSGRASAQKNTRGKSIRFYLQRR